VIEGRAHSVLQVAVSGGQIEVVDVPEPALRAGGVLVRTSHSLISVGTESASVGDGGRENLLVKAIRNPALVRKVADRVASHGLRSTLDLVRTRVSNETATGYAASGVVIGVGDGVSDLRPGDRVACAGAGWANHAAVNFVPRNLVVPLPENVSFEEGAFATLGAIALQGVRRCAPTLGESVVVLGLGLLGQITVQLLRASGAIAMGVDLRADRVARALDLGASGGFAVAERDFAAGVLERTSGRGADAVIVTAAGGDAGLLNRSFEACRRKGRVVLVGDVPIRIQRDRIYKKELDFLVSTSYGPGRYDPEYEEKGHDYPPGYVRWTEGRNLGEIVRLIGSGELRVRGLIDAVYPVEQAHDAYAEVVSEKRPIGVLLDYHLGGDAAVASGGAVASGTAGTGGATDGSSGATSALRTAAVAPAVSGSATASGPPPRTTYARRAPVALPGGDRFRVGVIGFGGYFRSMLLPLLRAQSGFALHSVCSRNGLTVRGAVERDGFVRGTTSWEELIADREVQVVYVATRHDQHYAIARAAVEAGKSVFVEKPMTLRPEDGRALADLVAERGVVVTVGFNRRFSPHAAALRAALRRIAAPKTMLYRVNAGVLPPDHWLLDRDEGGGRLIGEGVHFFDFLAFLAGARPVRVVSLSPRGGERNEAVTSIEYEDGSVGTVVYSGSGAADAGKERVEVFAGGAAFVLDDFRSLAVYGLAGVKGTSTRSVEKGQREQLENFHRALRGQEGLGVTAEDGWLATWCAEQACRGA